MSRLSEMIKELCPDGVEYRKLEDVLKICNGSDYKKFGEGDIPVYGSGGIMTYIDTYVYDKPSVLIPRKGSLDKLYYVDVPFWTVDTIFYTKISEEVLPKYIFYYLQSQHLERLNKAGGVPSLTQSILNKVIIPVPPLAIQNEIVKLLDNFTELTAELTAELQLRKKQYSFYRDSLLNFSRDDAEVEWKTLREISTHICSGGTPRKTNSAYYNGGTIPWLRTQEVAFNYIEKATSFITEEGLRNSSAKWIPAHCVIVAISGATAGRSAVNNIPITTNQHCCNFEINDKIADYKYVFYWVKSQYEQIKGLGRGARADLNADIIGSYPIPIPPLETQAKIVSILDRFDTLCNDLTQGLPAEIAARKKQYEYYRDKLLTFPRKGA